MKHQLAVLVVGLGSFLSARSVQASDDLAAGQRVRIRTADFVESPGLLRTSKAETIGLDPRTDKATGTVTITRPDGVRVNFPQARKTMVGKVVATGDGTLVVKLDGRDLIVTIPTSAIATTEVSMGRTGRRHIRGALIGLGAGAGLGAMLGFMSGDDTCTPTKSEPSFNFSLGFDGCFLTFSAGDKAAMAGILGAGAGAVVGLVVGAGRTDRWTEVKVAETSKFKLSAQPLGHKGLSLRFEF